MGLFTDRCPICGGNGRSEGNECNTCNGSGRVQKQPKPGRECTKCDGTGKLVDTDLSISYGFIDHFEYNCDRCGGSGKR